MSPALLQMLAIHKSFPGVHALRGVDVELRAGEVLALLGENGAGKSTLIKILAGAHRPDSGVIRIGGQEMTLANPVEARRAGVAVMYQELSLVRSLTVAENIFLGREAGRLGWLSHGSEKRRARELFARIGVALDPGARCGDLSIAQQQVVEIAKALALQSRILVMDEPSATLSPRETEHLFAVIRDLQKHGLGIIYISHRLDEIFAIADRVMVMRDGSHVGTWPILRTQPGEPAISRDQLIEKMVGRRLDQEFPKRHVPLGEPRLVASHLQRGRKVRDVSFSIRRGEILALTGLVGSGRTETARLIAGADPRDRGTVALDGTDLQISSPADALRSGIALLTEDRQGQGLVPVHSVRANFALPNLAAYSRYGFISTRRVRAAFQRHAQSLRIKLADAEEPIRNLSGGNQQKVILAKWLERNCAVLLFDEPTRGIDIGAKYDIYQLMGDLAAQGKAILMISSELPEVLGMADRILVMHEGRVTGTIDDVSMATQEQILKLAVRPSMDIGKW